VSDREDRGRAEPPGTASAAVEEEPSVARVGSDSGRCRGGGVPVDGMPPSTGSRRSQVLGRVRRALGPDGAGLSAVTLRAILADVLAVLEGGEDR
jgi:hypothetical protein